MNSEILTNFIAFFTDTWSLFDDFEKTCAKVILSLIAFLIVCLLAIVFAPGERRVK